MKLKDRHIAVEIELSNVPHVLYQKREHNLRGWDMTKPEERSAKVFSPSQSLSDSRTKGSAVLDWLFRRGVTVRPQTGSETRIGIDIKDLNCYEIKSMILSFDKWDAMGKFQGVNKPRQRNSLQSLSKRAKVNNRSKEFWRHYRTTTRGAVNDPQTDLYKYDIDVSSWFLHKFEGLDIEPIMWFNIYPATLKFQELEQYINHARISFDMHAKLLGLDDER